MFRTLAMIGLASTGAVIVVHFLAFRRQRFDPAGDHDTVPRLTGWERLLHLGVASSFLVLLVTGFQACLTRDLRLTGYALLLHCVAGGIFALSLALAALTWAEDCRFQSHDLQWVRRRSKHEERLPAGRFDCHEKILFWLTCLAGLVTLVSMALAMTSLLGSRGMAALHEVHRYGALVTVCLVGVHAYRTTILKPGTWQGLLSGRVGKRWARHYHSLWLNGIENGDGTTKT